MPALCMLVLSLLGVVECMYWDFLLSTSNRRGRGRHGRRFYRRKSIRNVQGSDFLERDNSKEGVLVAIGSDSGTLVAPTAVAGSERINESDSCQQQEAQAMANLIHQT